MIRNREANSKCMCKVCGKVFYAKVSLAQFCSTGCKNYNRTKHLTYKKKCIICGIDFETKTHNRVICFNPECQKEYNRQKARKYTETHKNPKIEKVRVSKERTQERERTWRESHKEYLQNYRKEYRKNNKEKIRARYNDRIKNDINFRLRQNLCKRIQPYKAVQRMQVSVQRDWKGFVPFVPL